MACLIPSKEKLEFPQWGFGDFPIIGKKNKEEFYQYINSEFVKGQVVCRDVYAPGTGEVIVSLAGAGKEQTLAALDAAQASFPM